MNQDNGDFQEIDLAAEAPDLIAPDAEQRDDSRDQLVPQPVADAIPETSSGNGLLQPSLAWARLLSPRPHAKDALARKDWRGAATLYEKAVYPYPCAVAILANFMLLQHINISFSVGHLIPAGV